MARGVGGPRLGAAAWARLAGLGLILAGCSGQPPNVVFDTPSGPVPLNGPASNTTSGPPPPPGMEPTQPAEARPVSRDGIYTGTATVLITNGNVCQDTFRVYGFHVNGNKVRFGGFRGTIQPDDGLQMVFGAQWIIGRFDGAVFHGQVAFVGPYGSPGCTYELTLRRTGA